MEGTWVLWNWSTCCISRLWGPAISTGHSILPFHLFSPLFWGQIFHFSRPVTPFFLPWLPSPLTILAPSQLPCRAEARGRRGGGRQPIPPSHWSEPAAPVLSLVAACRWWCLGRGDWLQMWTKGCLQKCSLLTIVSLTDSTWSHSVRLLILVYSSMRETLHWVSEDQVWKIVNFFLTMRSGGLNLHLESGSRWWCKELPDLVWHKLKTLTAREPGVLDRSLFYFVP